MLINCLYRCTYMSWSEVMGVYELVNEYAIQFVLTAHGVESFSCLYVRHFVIPSFEARARHM